MVNKWGILDTEDNVWIGNDAGPLLYDNQGLAFVAARMSDVQLGYQPGRCRAAEFIPQPVRLRDTVKAKCSPLKALEDLETGRVV
jgi:hypothetical protein